MKNLASFTHLVPNLYDLLFSVEHKINCYASIESQLGKKKKKTGLR